MFLAYLVVNDFFSICFLHVCLFSQIHVEKVLSHVSRGEIIPYFLPVTIDTFVSPSSNCSKCRLIIWKIGETPLICRWVQSLLSILANSTIGLIWLWFSFLIPFSNKKCCSLISFTFQDIFLGSLFASDRDLWDLGLIMHCFLRYVLYWMYKLVYG